MYNYFVFVCNLFSVAHVPATLVRRRRHVRLKTIAIHCVCLLYMANVRFSYKINVYTFVYGFLN